ncbi:MAG: hypothetical protein JSS98_15855, partial [Bacteroidetes bacterium]|nr:hypothetical protein [Bacteroidota bacterium]
MRKYFVITFLSMLPIFLYGQNKSLDSLEQLIKANPDNIELYFAKTDAYAGKDLEMQKQSSSEALALAEKQNNPKILAKALNQHSWYYLYANIPDSAILILKQILAIKEVKDDELFIAKVKTNLAQAYYSLGDFKTQLNFLNEGEKAIENKISQNDFLEQYKKILFLKSSAYYGIGLNDEALKAAFELRKIITQKKDDAMLAKYYNISGLIYEALGRYSDAKNNTLLSMQLFERTGEETNVARAYDNLARNYLLLKQDDSCMLTIDMALQKYKKLGLEKEGGKIIETKGNLLFHQKLYSKAITTYTEAGNLFKANNDWDFNAGVNMYIGQCWDSLNNPAMALKFYTDALNFFDSSGELSKVCELHFGLAKLQAKLGNTQKSLYHLSSYGLLNDSLNSVERQKSIVQTEIKYETSLKEATIAKQQSELKVQKQQQNGLITVALMVPAAAVGFGWLYGRAKKQKAIISKQNLLLEESNKTITKQKSEILHFQKNTNQLLYSMFNRQAENELQKDNVKANKERVFAMSLLHALLYEKQDNILSLKEYLEKLCE